MTAVTERVLVSLRRRSIRNTHYPLEEAKHDSNMNGLASLLQTWLFFGFLHEVFGAVGITIDEADFVTNDSSGAWLTTQALSEYLEMWKEKDAPESNTGGEAKGKGIRGLRKCRPKPKPKKAPDGEVGRQERGRKIMASLHWATKVAAEFEPVDSSTRIAESSLTFAVLILTYNLQQAASQL
jgi:hypothetical protein